MRNFAKFLTVGVFAVLATTWSPSRATLAQAPAPAQIDPQATFRVSIDLVTSDVIVRDQRDQFVSDLKPEEFEVFEDGAE